MNDYKLKLEVFKLTLNASNSVEDPNFRDMFSLKFSEGQRELNNIELFVNYNRFLSQSLDNKGEYHQINKKSKRAFSLSKLPKLNSKNQYVYGFVKGGFKGDNKTSSNIIDKNESESLDNKVIDNQHFFILYTPLESDTGFLIFQSYPQESIRLEFVNFISRYIFKHGKTYRKPKIQPYLTKAIKDEFKEGAIISQMTFTDKVMSNVLSNSRSFSNEPSHYKVKVVIEPSGEGKLTYKNFNDFNFFDKFKNKVILGKPLNDYFKKKGQLSKSGDKTPFTINGGDDILPIVRLGSGYLNDKGTPNFESVKKYSFELLKDIKEEFYENNKSLIIE
ncbi:hypothetical protein [Tenacibaculum maritimum]|uniref:hypothetical protein n=2 Tax=Tenacibaculum maritimum TaxID=107401 RepID=UPI0012E449BA|nr:hypothetical protein [Tenacibaculum maritimum]CAA0143700.1 hypothetical protein AQ1688_100075 [Tenacibaculum maritimum]CAA0143984.1 hypothetical protein AQ1685_110076 [Tenacibaculum maritimum]CAA0144521.1 hypothetical protein AQ1689_120046 [Tenacibaculum maritimum]CAA0157170.1 hypothetical protein CVI1001048_100046 [Tenacibaculum maritimum]CAA0203821.1 hypothetical protein JIP4600_250040 [Tenacibaculum maritimum]